MAGQLARSALRKISEFPQEYPTFWSVSSGRLSIHTDERNAAMMNTQRPYHIGARACHRLRTIAAVGSLTLGLAGPASADHGLPHLEILARGTFLDEVSTTIKLKGLDRGTQVFKYADASDMMVLRVTIEAGGVAPWHTHVGTGLLINNGPGTVTNLVGDECMPRVFLPGDAFVDPGDGELHGVLNESEEDVELIIVFFGIEEGQGPVVSTGGVGPEGCINIP